VINFFYIDLDIDPRYQPNIQQRSTITMPPQAQAQVSPGQATGQQASPGTGGSITSVDQEKAALIMQVLQLRDDQIAMLPHDQRQSILMLKEQIAQSATGLV